MKVYMPFPWEEEQAPLKLDPIQKPNNKKCHGSQRSTQFLLLQSLP